MRARRGLEVRNIRLGVDVDDVIDGKKNVIREPQFHDEIPDAAFWRIDQDAVDDAHAFVLRVAQFEPVESAARHRDMECGKVAKPINS